MLVQDLTEKQWLKLNSRLILSMMLTWSSSKEILFKRQQDVSKISLEEFNCRTPNSTVKLYSTFGLLMISPFPIYQLRVHLIWPISFTDQLRHCMMVAFMREHGMSKLTI